VALGYDTFATYILVEDGYSYEFGNVLLAELTDDFDDTIPSVYDYYPTDGSERIYLPPDQYNEGSDRLYISVSFDRPMDRQSVEDALTIEPPLDGGYFVWFQNTKTYTYVDVQQQYYWDGAYMLADSTMAGSVMYERANDAYVPTAEITTYSIAKSFTFYFPKAGCFTDTTYTITLATTAVDTAGTPLDSALEFSFKTVQSSISYSDIEMIPHDGDDWVSPLAPNGIQFTFPRRMDESTEEYITVNLEPNPIFLWRDFNKLTIYTGGIFVPDTTYVITIGADAPDLGGEPLGEEKVLTFATEPIRITATDPARGELGVNTDSYITLTFNTHVDRSSIAGRATLSSAAGDTVGCTYNNGWRCYNTYCTDTTFYLHQIRVTPVTRLARNTFYTFALEPGVRDLKGYEMKTGYELEFITMP
jgi:hypothetical protein